MLSSISASLHFAVAVCRRLDGSIHVGSDSKMAHIMVQWHCQVSDV